MLKDRVFILLSLLISLLGVLPLLMPGLPPTHDGEYHVVRFAVFDHVIREGILYPRWAPFFNNGLGIPLFNYVYPVPNYFSSFLHLFGISFIDSFKLNLFVATLLGAAFFYLWTKKYWGSAGGLLSSTFYSFAPYRFVDIYIRGSVGEVWAMAFFPGYLYFLDRLIENKNTKYLILSSLCMALVILSHNILGLMFFPFALSYLIMKVYKKSSRDIIKGLSTLFFSLGLSSVFWIPAILESKFTKGLEIFNIKSNFPDLYQLIFPSWGSGFSGNVGSISDQMSFQIGLANLLVIFLAVLLIRKIREKRITIFFLASFFVVFFLMLEHSYSVWKYFPLLNYFQFPWRFLSLEILICAFLAGLAASVFRNEHLNKLIVLLLITLSIGLAISYARPPFYHMRGDDHYLSRSNFTDGTNSPGNSFNTIWIDGILEKEKNLLKINKEMKVDFLEDKSTYHKFSIKTDESLEAVVVNIAYFPGWKAFIDGKEARVKASGDGKLVVDVPSGEHLVEIRFVDTIVRRLATITSLTFVLLLLVLVIRENLNESRNRHIPSTNRT